jgi:hypothetical protein
MSAVIGGLRISRAGAQVFLARQQLEPGTRPGQVFARAALAKTASKWLP